MARIEASPSPAYTTIMSSSGGVLEPDSLSPLRQMKEAGFNLSEMPLSFVPYARLVNLNQLETAGHELNHALVAQTLGLQILQVSVRPEGNSLGRTVFAGQIDLNKFIIAAAAGAVATPFGQARGFGGDFAQIGMISLAQGFRPEASVFQARLNAESILNGYNLRSRQKAAQIIAYLGEVSGSMIPQIIERAKMEIELEDLGLAHLLEKPGNIERPEARAAEMPKVYTIVETLVGGDTRFKFIEDGKITKEEVVCGSCGGINTHHPNCPMGKKREENLREGLFPPRGTIFSYPQSLRS